MIISAVKIPYKTHTYIQVDSIDNFCKANG